MSKLVELNIQTQVHAFRLHEESTQNSKIPKESCRRGTYPLLQLRVTKFLMPEDFKTKESSDMEL